MPPDDPLGRNGPTLDQFLRKRPAFGDLQPCPYGKKCTYGNKCKFFHAERGNQPHKSVTDKLKEHSSQKINEVRARGNSRDSSPGTEWKAYLNVPCLKCRVFFPQEILLPAPSQCSPFTVPRARCTPSRRRPPSAGRDRPCPTSPWPSPRSSTSRSRSSSSSTGNTNAISLLLPRVLRHLRSNST